MIALTPSGRLLDDGLVDELAAEDLTLLCGRYEGFDERIVENMATESISIGRYVLSGGELAAMVLCDAVLRKLPGALGHEQSASRSRSASRSTATPSIRITPARPPTAAGRCPSPALGQPRADRRLAARAEPLAWLGHVAGGAFAPLTLHIAPRGAILAFP